MQSTRAQVALVRGSIRRASLSATELHCCRCCAITMLRTEATTNKWLPKPNDVQAVLFLSLLTAVHSHNQVARRRSLLSSIARKKCTDTLVAALCFPFRCACEPTETIVAHFRRILRDFINQSLERLRNS